MTGVTPHDEGMCVARLLTEYAQIHRHTLSLMMSHAAMELRDPSCRRIHSYPFPPLIGADMDACVLVAD